MRKTFKAKFNPKGTWVNKGRDGKILVRARARNVYEITCTDIDTKKVVYWRFVWGLNELYLQIEQIADVECADKIFHYFADKRVLELNPIK